MAKEEECRQCSKCKVSSYGTLKCSFYGRTPIFDETPCSKFKKGASSVGTRKNTVIPKEVVETSVEQHDYAAEGLKKSLNAWRIAAALIWFVLIVGFSFVAINNDYSPSVIAIVFIATLIPLLIIISIIDRKRKRLMTEEDIQKQKSKDRIIFIVVMIIIVIRFLLRLMQ